MKDCFILGKINLPSPDRGTAEMLLTTCQFPCFKLLFIHLNTTSLIPTEKVLIFTHATQLTNHHQRFELTAYRLQVSFSKIFLV